MTRVLRIAYWLAPVCFCTGLYWLGLRIWFQQDDFAWLYLRHEVAHWSDLWRILFRPMAQGTIRPWSERAYFMALSYWFGIHPLPFRLLVFANQAVNLILLMIVTRKLTGSAVAGFAAPVLWVSNAVLVEPLAWSSAYNEIQCAGFLLLSFYLFLQFTESGERKYYVLQWITFLLGFGALELNVMYPVIAAGYAALCARRWFRHTLPLFIPSILFTVAHRWVAPPETTWYYEMHPAQSLSTLAAYVKIFFTGGSDVGWSEFAGPFAIPLIVLFAGALLGFVVWQAWNKQFLPLFFVLWFLAALLPFLPLSHHLVPYYLSIPSLGIAMLAAQGIGMAWNSRRALAVAATVLAAVYAGLGARLVTLHLDAFYANAERVRMLVESVAYAEKVHPNKVILLTAIDNDLFWSGVYDAPFHILGWNNVYVTPETEARIEHDQNRGSIDDFFLPSIAVNTLLLKGQAIIYTPQGNRLRNISREYSLQTLALGKPSLSRKIDLGTDYYDDQLGHGWYEPEGAYRWMSPRATLFLRGPDRIGEKLYIRGRAPDQLIRQGPVMLQTTIDGRAAPPRRIDAGNQRFEFGYDLPRELVGSARVEVEFSIDRSLRVAGDNRELGLIVSRCEIR